MQPFHAALSFAGEDRDYVRRVAKHLKTAGVEVFYDEFEETTLWGKDLYTHLSDVYQNQAYFTVMFISQAYADKLWTNHERRSAQARAFAERREYILPAYFDPKVDVAGVLPTTGHLDLRKFTPEQFAERIIKKLREHGVLVTIEDRFAYSDHARADVDFPMRADSEEVSAIVAALRTYNWYKQSPAIEKIFELKWSKRTPDEIFVLGRNIYQCACGEENRAEALLNDLRRSLAKLPIDAAEHLLNGMFFEAYFNSKGEFRGAKPKSKCLIQLFGLQAVEKYANSIAFIRKELDPYRDQLGVLPNASPETLVVTIKINTDTDPHMIRSFKCLDRERLVDEDDGENETFFGPKGVTVEGLRKKVATFWHIPLGQLEIKCVPSANPDVRIQLPDRKVIGPLAG
jgi:hypothetical protein